MTSAVRYCNCYKSLKEKTIRCPNKATFGEYCGHHKNCQIRFTQQGQTKQAPDYLSGEASLVLQKIASYLPTKDLMSFAQVNRRMAMQTKQERELRKLETLTEIDYGQLTPQQQMLFRQCQILPNCVKLKCGRNQLTRLPPFRCVSTWCVITIN